MRLKLFFILTILFCANAILAQKKAKIQGYVTNTAGEALMDVQVLLVGSTDYRLTDDKGYFSFQLAVGDSIRLAFHSIQIESDTIHLLLRKDTSIRLRIPEKMIFLEETIIRVEADPFGIRRLRSTEDGGLYEAKKTEVINIEKLIGNKAGNNARQAFGKVPSLNIWESDNAGLQLDIGGRGLSPKRTSNFNTRQNGYDISADALGYPESYYTPPLQAVQQIEMVRGAGALQYGSQFGGLLNFKMRKGSEDKALNIESENSYGAYNFFNTFNSVHGQSGKFNYFTYLQYKRGDGWRENSTFEQYGAYGSISYQASPKLRMRLDYTHMNYLSQQAGGQTDEQFAADPRASNRDRNWFRVNWNLAAFSLQYDLSDNSKLYSRTFGLSARRTSLGLRETPDLEDPLSNRDLIDGSFRNIGNETRWELHYKGFKDLENTLLVGTRLYRGFTTFSQQFGTAGADADFRRVDTSFLDRRRSAFDFPNFNAALFAEKIVRLSPGLSLIPGIRYEYIDTEADGYFTTFLRLNSFGDFIEEEQQDRQTQQRHILLYGLGLSKKLGKKYELYANATANYRAINFTDIQIQTNTQVVDSMIRDESGYSFDLGIRRMDFSPFFVEAGLFYIWYNNRIGEVIDDGLRLRTNIGAAQIIGFELYLEVDALAALKIKSDQHKLSLFVNGSINRGLYSRINNRALVGVRSGNKIEDLPDYNVKAGISYGYDRFSTTLQATYVGAQFSDAANTERPFSGVFGPIPAYSVYDLSARYEVSKLLRLSASVNNLLNRAYFTRRAPAYPGPGILPALGRTWQLTVAVRV